MRTSLITATVIAWAVCRTGAAAATISFLGVQTNVEGYANDTAGWRSTTTVKTYDPDGDNVLGTDGYRLFPINSASLPGYVASLAGAPDVSDWAGGGGYALVDNPAGGSDISSGVFYHNGVSGGQTLDMFSFTLMGTVPAAFAVHLMAGASDNATTTEHSVFSFAQTTGGSALEQVALDASSFDNSGPDWYSFLIAGAVAGDVFTVRLTNSGSNSQNLQVGGIAFDASPVPEPGHAFPLLGLMATSLLFRRRCC